VTPLGPCRKCEKATEGMVEPPRDAPSSKRRSSRDFSKRVARMGKLILRRLSHHSVVQGPRIDLCTLHVQPKAGVRNVSVSSAPAGHPARQGNGI